MHSIFSGDACVELGSYYLHLSAGSISFVPSPFKEVVNITNGFSSIQCAKFTHTGLCFWFLWEAYIIYINVVTIPL